MKRFKMIHGVGLVGLVFSLFAVPPSRADADDILPWPVGVECPFPWTSIEGDWISVDGPKGHNLHFVLEKTLKDGSRVLGILHYNDRGDLIGWGRGISPRGEKAVRLLMEYVSSDLRGAYWGMIRTYTRPGEPELKSCRSRSSKITVFSMAPVDNSAQGQEIHMVIEKASTKSKK